MVDVVDRDVMTQLVQVATGNAAMGATVHIVGAYCIHIDKDKIQRCFPIQFCTACSSNSTVISLYRFLAQLIPIIFVFRSLRGFPTIRSVASVCQETTGRLFIPN